jgi:hypothetical protein
MNFPKFFAAAVIATAFAAPANAVTLTFEGHSNTIYDAPITRSGFDVGNVVGDQQHFHEITSTSFGLPNNGTGVLMNDRDTRIFVEGTLDAPFTLGTFDVASALANGPAVGILIEGFFNNFSTGVITVAVLGTGYTTLDGTSLGVVDRLVFDGIGGQGGFVLDNIALNAAPVPGPIVGAGLPGLWMAFGGFLAWRRRKAIAA